MKKTSKKKLPQKRHKVIYPPSIKKGDTIGIVSPASSLVGRDLFTEGVKILKKKGFMVKFIRKHLNAKGYLAGSDMERADAFNRLWADPEVKALVAARGGYGCLRLIDQIDMKQIRGNPKILIGFSDITVLLNAIHNKTGLITFHGPVVTTLASIDRQSTTEFFNTLMDTAPKNIQPTRVEIIKNGTAKGILQGGNLTSLVHMVDTPYEFSWKDTILFIEDIDEPPYKLDRLLTHLFQAKRLQKIKGLILGTFTDGERKENRVMQKAVLKRIVELLDGFDIPVWANFPVGHSRRNLTLPIGVKMKMDSSKGSCTLQLLI